MLKKDILKDRRKKRSHLKEMTSLCLFVEIIFLATVELKNIQLFLSN